MISISSANFSSTVLLWLVSLCLYMPSLLILILASWYFSKLFSLFCVYVSVIWFRTSKFVAFLLDTLAIIASVLCAGIIIIIIIIHYHSITESKFYVNIYQDLDVFILHTNLLTRFLFKYSVKLDKILYHSW